MADLSVTDLNRRIRRLESRVLTFGDNTPEQLTGVSLGVDVANNQGIVRADATGITFTASQAASASVSDNGDGTATVDLSATDTNTDTQAAVSDSGVEVVSNAGDINFGANLSAADDGDGTATVDYDANPGHQRAPITTTTLADTEHIAYRDYVPNGRTLEIRAVGVQDASNSAPTGLTADVVDETNSTTLLSENSRRSEGNPLATKSGPFAVAFRVDNATGGGVDASGWYEYRVV